MQASKLIFLDSLLFSSIFLLNHMSFQGVFTKDFYHGTVMIPKQYRVLLLYSCTRVLRKENLNLLKNKTQLS